MPPVFFPIGGLSNVASSVLPDWALEITDLLNPVLVGGPDAIPPETPPDLANGMRAQYKRIREAVERLTVLADPDVTDPAEVLPWLNHLGSNARLQWLVEFHNSLSTQLIAELLPGLWVDPNMAIGGPVGFTRTIAIELFERTGFSTDGPARPTRPTVIYHGVVFPIPPDVACPTGDMWDGMAWTSDLEVARRFAGGVAPVYTATAEPGQVLARYDRRNESEYVVDPATLTDIRRKE